MKKKGLKIAIVFICMGMAGIFWQNRQTVSLNELALENVEALAQGEFSGCETGCVDNGDGCFCNMWFPSYAYA